MRILLDGIEKNLPTSLAEITIGQRIAFHEQYGKDLEKQFEEIIAMPEGWRKSIALSAYQDQLAASYVCFFLEVKPYLLPADAVMSLYAVIFNTLQQEEAEITPEFEFNWKGETWVLASPILTTSHSMCFGELVDAKQIIKDLAEDQGTRWDMLHRLACIFLRLPGEQYEQSFSEKGSNRYQLMMDLPMDAALQVGFFLTSWISSFRNASQFLGRDAEVEAETLRNILTDGAGYISSNLLPKPKFLTGSLTIASRLRAWLKQSMSWFSPRKKRTIVKR